MVVIIDFGMGNLGSIKNMLKKIGYPSIITSEKSLILSSTRLILPGVGSFDKAMSNLNSLGLVDIIRQKAHEGIPLLGICLGMQLFAGESEEGVLPGIGIISGKVKKIQLPSRYKIPHMGWNNVKYNKSSPLFKGFDSWEETRFYFVHSYHFVCEHTEHIAATTDYGFEFTSSVQKANVLGVQFHPEKSHKYGMHLLTNFMKISTINA